VPLLGPYEVNTVSGPITRREVLVLGVVDAAGLAALPAILAACGSSPASPSPSASTSAAATAPPSTAAVSTPSSPAKATPSTPEPLGVIEDTRVVFYRTELSVINDSGVLLNLVARDGPVGIRFYKDFGFGNEKQTNPWHMGYIERTPDGTSTSYQGLAILRDWAFTAALWDGDGRLTVGRLDPYPPGNPPADARFQVRGTVDEVQARIDGTRGQKADIFEVTSSAGLDTSQPPTPRVTVRGDGDLVLGSPQAPTALVIHDTVTGKPYEITVSNGQIRATPVDA
jgi:hypothetical protein